MLEKISFFKFLTKPSNSTEQTKQTKIQQTKQKYRLAYDKAETQLKLAEAQLKAVMLEKEKVEKQYPTKIIKWWEDDYEYRLSRSINQNEVLIQETEDKIYFGKDRGDPAASAKKINALKQSLNQEKIELTKIRKELKEKSIIEEHNINEIYKIGKKVENYESKVKKAQFHYGRKKIKLVEWMSTHCPEELHNLDPSNQATLQNKY